MLPCVIYWGQLCDSCVNELSCTIPCNHCCEQIGTERLAELAARQFAQHHRATSVKIKHVSAWGIDLHVIFDSCVLD